mgnify:CR=1 FL=1
MKAAPTETASFSLQIALLDELEKINFKNVIGGHLL